MSHYYTEKVIPKSSAKAFVEAHKIVEFCKSETAAMWMLKVR